jgi:proteasome assembly chaperone (PAC2) family protein
MPPLHIFEGPDPELNEPILVAAFAGWSDAGGGASGAAKYLIDRWHANRIAEIDSEDFYDFTQLRPTVKYVHDLRVIEWPQNAFYYHRTADKDLIIFNGIEPHLHWRSYIKAFTDVIERFKVSLVVSLGALFVDYPHTRPMRVTGQAPNEEMQEKAGLYTRGGRYEGPTGVNGVLNVSLREMDIPSATIWANVPHYVSASPNPPASLAILKSLTAMLDIEVPLTRMTRHATAFESQLNEATSKNSEVSEYVKSLEERVDQENEIIITPQELPSSDVLLQDVEDFLRRSGKE